MDNNRPMARLAGAIAIALASGTVSAADLQNFVLDLYGGDGITLSSQGGPFAAVHAAHFTDESLEAFTLLNSAIASSAGTFAFNSTFTGITFDVATGVPVETQDSLGPLLAESATTLGKGKINLAFGASRFKYDRIDGQELDNIVLDFPHEDCCSFQGGIQRPPPDGVLSGFETDLVRVTLDIDLEYDVFAFFANYGLTDRWDVGIVVPVISVDANARAHAEVVDPEMAQPAFIRSSLRTSCRTHPPAVTRPASVTSWCAPSTTSFAIMEPLPTWHYSRRSRRRPAMKRNSWVPARRATRLA